MAKLSENAAIAQSVERILGKDEVASSNLASSSKKSVIPTGMADFLFAAITAVFESPIFWDCFRCIAKLHRNPADCGSHGRKNLFAKQQILPA